MLADVLSRFLSKDHVPEVLCLRGPWGVGKTYAWKKALELARKNNALATSSYSYVSLFGINSIEGMRSSILENFELLNAKKNAQWFGKNANKIVKFAPAIGALLGQSELTSVASTLAFGAVRNQIICIDDLERRGEDLRLQDVFGLASFLHEARNCRIAILLNEDKLDDGIEEYQKYYEKVVTASVLYSPTPAEIAKVAIQTSGALDDMLRSECTKLGISNVRIVQRVRTVAREAEPYASQLHSGVLENLAHSAALLVWCYFDGEGAPPVTYLKDKYGAFSFGDVENTAEEKLWSEKLDLYQWGILDDLDKEILRRLETGYFDDALLKVALDTKDRELRAKDRSLQVSCAWDQYNDSFEDNEEQVISAFLAAYEANKMDITPARLDGILGLLRNLGKSDVADQLATEYASMREGGHESFNVRHLGGYDPISDPILIELFNQRYEMLVPAQTIDQELADLAAREGWNDNRLEFLASCEPAEYERVFRSLRGEQLADTIRACLQFQNITNANEAMRTIVDKARIALANIGRSSALNAQRVAKFGIRSEAS